MITIFPFVAATGLNQIELSVSMNNVRLVMIAMFMFVEAAVALWRTKQELLHCKSRVFANAMMC